MLINRCDTYIQEYFEIYSIFVTSKSVTAILLFHLPVNLFFQTISSLIYYQQEFLFLIIFIIITVFFTVFDLINFIFLLQFFVLIFFLFCAYFTHVHVYYPCFFAIILFSVRFLRFGYSPLFLICSSHSLSFTALSAFSCKGP